MIKLKEILTESIPDYFRGYFSNIDDNMERLVKEVARERLQKLESQEW